MDHAEQRCADRILGRHAQHVRTGRQAPPPRRNATVLTHAPPLPRQLARPAVAAAIARLIARPRVRRHQHLQRRFGRASRAGHGACAIPPRLRYWPPAKRPTPPPSAGPKPRQRRRDPLLHRRLLQQFGQQEHIGRAAAGHRGDRGRAGLVIRPRPPRRSPQQSLAKCALLRRHAGRGESRPSSPGAPLPEYSAWRGRSPPRRQQTGCRQSSAPP